MSAPRLTRWLTLEDRQRVPDGAGGYVEAWVPLGTLWAAVDARSGRGVAGPAGAQARLGLRITVRAAAEGSPARPVPGQRLRDGGRVFAVHAVGESHAGALYLDLHAEEERVR
ncbi:head-tail adaptor protein [Histidinibacterium lentulum]|uniref:Head-tail adaptor protein n=1 Tax=Histidinibacterium lentulum TaxID=2480588 RepID=A0A3N2R4H8_9RHOB|nr:head-tail adaptor protein [Histidinibacterium lentulum]ROU02399.1 head-tail adaptor protein [Histidinibacterium lentulum]